jgi:hypothetical protein
MQVIWQQLTGDPTAKKPFEALKWTVLGGQTGGECDVCTLRFTATNPKIESFLCHIMHHLTVSRRTDQSVTKHESSIYVFSNGCIVYNSVSWLSALLLAIHHLKHLDDQLSMIVS